MKINFGVLIIIVIVAYVLLPDLIPGPVDDAGVVAAGLPMALLSFAIQFLMSKQRAKNG